MTSRETHTRGDSNLPEFLKQNVKSDLTETRRLMDLYVEGLNAEAKIISIEEAGIFGNRNYYKMTIDVTPPHSHSFRTTGFAPISGNLLPRVDDRINIKYNPSEIDKFVIV